jgi:hypothetical protein
MQPVPVAVSSTTLFLKMGASLISVTIATRNLSLFASHALIEPSRGLNFAQIVTRHQDLLGHTTHHPMQLTRVARLRIARIQPLTLFARIATIAGSNWRVSI